MKVKFVIIGGGVAGLCAAIRLAESGEEPVLIEAGSYPAHKICGEFLSPECLPILYSWDIHPILIPRAILRSESNSMEFSFPFQAGGMSHISLDPALALKAAKSGAIIKTDTRVSSFLPKQSFNDAHHIELSTGETLEATHAIIASGRIPGYTINPAPISYMGFKAHFKDIDSEGDLEMFSLNGAYLGIAPIEDSTYNVACLADIKKVRAFGDPDLFMENLISLNSSLNKRLTKENRLFDRWMSVQVPEFGIKQTPDWLDTYFIGDAAVTVPPACGNGLALAIFGGRLAAEYALANRALDFKSDWKKSCSSQMFWTKFLHRVMLNPTYSNALMALSRCFPYVANKIYRQTRR